MSDHITILGNLTTNPSVHYSQNGAAVVRLRVAVNRRRFDRQRGEWADLAPVFHNVVAFGSLAENIADSSLATGDAVMVVGEFADDSYASPESGRTQQRVQVRAQAIGPDLTRATATVTKVRRETGAGCEPELAPALND
jgi:single-strand DNA-binding protein